MTDPIVAGSITKTIRVFTDDFKRYQAGLRIWRYWRTALLIVVTLSILCVAGYYVTLLLITFRAQPPKREPYVSARADSYVPYYKPCAEEDLCKPSIPTGPNRRPRDKQSEKQVNPPASMAQNTQIAWRDTALIWAKVHNAEAHLHFDEMVRNEEERLHREKLQSALISCFTSPWALVVWTPAVLLIIALAVWDSLHHPSPNLAFAAAIADIRLDEVGGSQNAPQGNKSSQEDSADVKTKLRGEEQRSEDSSALFLRPWSHEVLSPELLESVATDPRLDPLMERYVYSPPSPVESLHARLTSLTKDREFRYLLLSIADQRRTWRANLMRIVTSATRYIRSKPVRGEAKQASAALGLGAIAALLAAASIIPVIGQYVATTHISDQISKSSTDTRILVERYLPAPDFPKSPDPPDVQTQSPAPISIQNVLPDAPQQQPSPVSIQNVLPSNNVSIPPINIMNNVETSPTSGGAQGSTGNTKPISGSDVQVFFRATRKNNQWLYSPESPDPITLYYLGGKHICTFKLVLSPPSPRWPPDAIHLVATAGDNTGIQADENCPVTSAKAQDVDATSSPRYNAFLNADVSIDKLTHSNRLMFGVRRVLVIHIHPRDLVPQGL